MKSYNFAFLIAITCTVACTQVEFAKTKSAPTEAGDLHSLPPDSLPVPSEEFAIEPQVSVSEPTPQLTPELTPEFVPEIAIEPTMIGGAYLVCVQSESLECRLDTVTNKNIPIPAGFKEQFSHADGSLVMHTGATLEGFRWRLSNFIATPPLSKVLLKITSPSGRSWLYRAEVENQALQIGDGTTRLQGCTLSFVRSSRLVGLRYERTFTLNAGESAFMIDLTGLCGIIRANDSFVQVLDSSGQEVFKRFLPVSANALPLSLTVEGLSSGVYTLALIPGDNLDIDDFFINSLAISSLVP